MFGHSWYRPVGGKVERLMDRCEACDACLTSKIHFFGVVKGEGHIWTLWTHQAAIYIHCRYTLMKTPPTVFTRRNTSVLNPEKRLSSLNPCVPNCSLSASAAEGASAAQRTCASSSSDSHQAVLRAAIAYMSCALRVGIPCLAGRSRTLSSPLFSSLNTHLGKDPGAKSHILCIDGVYFCSYVPGNH